MASDLGSVSGAGDISAAAAGAQWHCPAASLFQAQHGQEVDVVIVGAGVAGLGAAQRLMRSPETRRLRVVVLEAGPHVGGRLRQDRTFFADGTPLDVGAELVHGANNEMVHLAEAAGTKLHQLFTWSQGDGGPSEEPAPDGSVGYYWLPSEQRMARYDELPDAIEHMHDTLHSIGDEAQSMFDTPEALDKARNLEPGSQGTVMHHLASKQIQGDSLKLASAGFGNTTGGILEELSLERIGSFERAWGKDGEEADYRMVGGYAPFLRWISTGVPVSINSPVTAIDCSAGSAGAFPISVVFEQRCPACERHDIASGSCSTTTPTAATRADPHCAVIRCKRVIVTIPPPVLRSGFVKFQPPLSDTRCQALSRIQLRNGIKVALKFKRRVWPTDCMGLVSGGTVFPEMWMNSVGGLGAVVAPPPVAEHAHGLQGLANDLKSGAVPAAPVQSTSMGAPPPVEGAPFLVIGFAMGPFADRLLQLHPDEAVRAMLQQLATMFHQRVPSASTAFTQAFVSGRVYSWALDKWIQGAYTCPSILEHPGDRTELAKPHADGQVLFAGEAVSGANESLDSPLTLHGALRTGIHAAQTVAAALGTPSTGPTAKL